MSESYIEEQRATEAEAARRKADTYRDDGRVPDLRGKRVVVADDGVATGATAMAYLDDHRAE